jgi:N-acetylglucosaminyldiphosphoundecaprenol N-acetyl-beta-D-mannosaminyltransferase
MAYARSIRLMSVDLSQMDSESAIDFVFSSLATSCGGWVITPNLDILRRLHRDPEFSRLCSGASLRLADGMPLVWASRLKGTPLPERVAGSDLIWTLSARAARDGRSVFFLGGNPGSAAAAAQKLSHMNPGLIVAGVECPPFGFESDPDYMRTLIERLQSARSDIVFVALGSPKQERLIVRLRELMPSTWFLGIGVSFSFVSGELRRAPVWLRRIGLEWVHRLLQEPRRLARRYLVDGIPFAVRLLMCSAFERFARR